jgi:hypothetical protein
MDRRTGRDTELQLRDRAAAAAPRAFAQGEHREKAYAACEEARGHEHRILRCDLHVAVGVEDHPHFVADGVTRPTRSRGSSARTGMPSGPVYSTTSVA